MTGEMPGVEICHLPMTGQTVITIRLPDELFQAAHRKLVREEFGEKE